ncbi:hypothetical protein CL632_00915 [bacterium]|nr:hypothetical protein [bacterium]
MKKHIFTAIVVVIAASTSVLAGSSSIGIALSEGIVDLNDGISFSQAGAGIALQYVNSDAEMRASFEVFRHKREVSIGDTTTSLKKDLVYIYSLQPGMRLQFLPVLYFPLRLGFTMIQEEELQFDITAHTGVGLAFKTTSGWEMDFIIPFGFYPNRGDEIQNLPHINAGIELSIRKMLSEF